MTTLAAINKKIEQLKKQADAIIQSGRREAIARARDLIGKFSLTADDLGLGKNAGPGRAAAAKKAVRAAASIPKYRDPATGKTWTGVGRAPAWIVAAKDRSKFLAGSGSGGEADAPPRKVRGKKNAAAGEAAAKAPKGSSPIKTKKATARQAAKRVAAKKAAGSAEALSTAAEQGGETSRG